MPRQQRQRRLESPPRPLPRRGPLLQPRPAPAMTLGIYATLVLATVFVFGDVRHFDFINLDDPAYVWKNPHLTEGLTWASVRWAFGQPYEGYWAPLLWLSYLVDYAVYGLWAGGFHLTNLFLHVASTCLLYASLERMTRASLASAFVALLFAIHPMHVESVAWITERKDTLSIFFWMLTMWLYVRYVERPSRSRYAGVIAAFVGGLLSKVLIVSLPVVLLCLDLWPLRRRASWRWLVLEKTPMVVLGIAGAVVTLLTQGHAGALASLAAQPIPIRLENAVVSYGTYLLQLVWPVNLAVIYPYPLSVPIAPLFASAIVLAGISIVTWRVRHRHPYALVGWIWFLVAILPVCGLTQAGPQARADRYTYISYVGLFIAIVYLVADGVARRAVLVRAALAGGVVACVGLGVVAWHQVQYWRDTETVMRRTLAVTTNNYVALSNLGVWLLDAHRADDALPLLQEGVRVLPGRANAHLNLATALNTVGRIDEAEAEYRKAVQLGATATAASGLGTALIKQGRLTEAAEAFATAVANDPTYADAHFNRGRVFIMLGQPADAERSLREAIRLSPDFVEAHGALGGLLASDGRVAEALPELAAVARLRPDDAMAHSNLGTVLVSANRVDDAIKEFEAAVRLRPDVPELRANLDRARSLKGK